MKYEAEKKDVSIQMIRILSMFSIILCHWVCELNNPTIAKMSQFFNVGVYIFLFLSGWLYGKKKISDIRKWYIERVKRVLIPMWLFMIFLLFIHYIKGTMKWIDIPIYMTNTQYWFEKNTLGGAFMVCKCYFCLLFNNTIVA